MKRILFDHESDGFVDAATRLHCIAACDVDTRERFEFGPSEITRGVELIEAADVQIAHNGQRHDIPLLEKLYPGFKRRKVIDTMIYARVTYPNIRDGDYTLIKRGEMPNKAKDGKSLAGRHSIEAWGYRLKQPKLHADITDWSTWTREIQERCVGDCTTNVALWDVLQKEAVPDQVLELEHEIAALCDLIERTGCPFDTKEAGRLHATLIERRDELKTKLQEQFGFWYAPISPDPEKYTFTPARDNKRMGYTAGVPMCKIEKVDFNPGSRDHIAKVLMDRGWKPTEFTPGGKPQVDEGTVEALSIRFPESQGLAEYLMLAKRLGQLADGDQAWMKHVGEDRRIHGVINPMGCQTSRASHFNPNLGQVPNSGSPYGPECRALFSGYPMLTVGADQEGLELRVLAHYLAPYDGGHYGRLVLAGDPHWANVAAMGLWKGPRDKHNALHAILREHGSKRFIYAAIYGCWELQAGQIVYDCLLLARKLNDDGAALYRQWFPRPISDKELRRVGRKVLRGLVEGIAGYSDLKDKLKRQVGAFGWIPGLDGRRIPTRSEHSALNYLIQSCGAILCKRWGVTAFGEIKQTFNIGWTGDTVPLLWVHDEYQYAAKAEVAKAVGEILVKHAQKAGEPYGFRIRLDSKYKIGRTWADTH